MKMMIKFENIREMVKFLKENLREDKKILIYAFVDERERKFKVFEECEGVYINIDLELVIGVLDVEDLEDYLKEEFKYFRNVALAL